jgi:putative transposase
MAKESEKIHQETRCCKVLLTPNQVEIFDHWVELERQAWNACLGEIDFTNDYRAYNPLSAKAIKKYEGDYCSPIPWSYSRYFLDNGCYSRDENNKDKIDSKDDFATVPLEIGYKNNWGYFAPCCHLVDRASNWIVKQLESSKESDNGWIGGYGYSCPISYHYWENDGGIDFINPVFGFLFKASNKAISAKFRNEHFSKFRLETQEVLNRILNGQNGLPKLNQKVLDSFCNHLSMSFESFKKGDGGKPKFRGKKNTPKSIENSNPDGCIKINPDDTISGFCSTTFGENKNNTLIAPGISKIWRNHDGTIPKVTVIKIVKKNRGFEVHLTGPIQNKKPSTKQPDKMIGLDPGLIHYMTDDSGNTIEMPRFYKRIEKTLAKLQSQVIHKQKENLIIWLNDPSRTTDDIKKLANISEDKASKLLSISSESKAMEIISNNQWQSLLHRLPINLSGNRIVGLRNKIAKLQEKAALQRKQFIEYHTTRLARNYNLVAIEDGLQGNKLRSKPNAKQDESGKFLPNGASAKKGLNKSFADRSIGRFTSRLSDKLKLAGGELVKVPSAYTSCTCPVCGNKDTGHSLKRQRKNKSRILTCSNCNESFDRDAKAANFILQKGYEILTKESLTIDHPHAKDNPLREHILTRKQEFLVKQSSESCGSVGVKSSTKKKTKSKADTAKASRVKKNKPSAPVDNSAFKGFGPLFG